MSTPESNLDDLPEAAAPDDERAAFDFVKVLAAELSSGKIDLPSFPEIALRVREVLADEDVQTEKVVRIVGSEPALAARLLQIANSAALNFSGKPVTELRTAIARLGFNMVRSASIAFAMAQLKKAESLKGLERPLDALWRRSMAVAATAYTVARRLTKINPDTGLLAGLLHVVGELYILTRITQHPDLFANEATYEAIVRKWHSSIGRAILENWGILDEIVWAVSEFEDLERDHSGPPDLTDVITVAYLLVSYREHPENIELNLQGVSAAQRLQLDHTQCEKLLSESAEEIASMERALGR